MYGRSIFTASLALFATYASALPTPAKGNSPGKRAVVQHNGRLIDCDEIAFLAVMPPSELELKCRAAEAADERHDDLVGDKRSVPVAKRAVVKHNGRLIDCDEIAFLAVMPPSELELKCRAAEAAEERQADLVDDKRDVEIIKKPAKGKRAVVQHEGRLIDCDEIAFLAVMPPSELELKCRAAEAEEDKQEAEEDRREGDVPDDK